MKFKYRISWNKRQGAFSNFRLKGGALIGRRALNGGGWGALIKFSFQRTVTLFWLNL